MSRRMAATAPARTTDRIIYLLTTEPGGQDGRDRDDKGGEVVAVSFDRTEVEARKGRDTRLTIQRQIVDDSNLRAAYAKLSTLDRYLIEADIGSRCYDCDRGC